MMFTGSKQNTQNPNQLSHDQVELDCSEELLHFYMCYLYVLLHYLFCKTHNKIEENLCI